jgi:hypothetical protein
MFIRNVGIDLHNHAAPKRKTHEHYNNHRNNRKSQLISFNDIDLILVELTDRTQVCVCLDIALSAGCTMPLTLCYCRMEATKHLEIRT